MESKLKALKVVDLKEILSKAQVTVTGKANKSDLITKIIASPEATKVYEEQYGSPASKDASTEPIQAVSKPTSGAASSKPTELSGQLPNRTEAKPTSSAPLSTSAAALTSSAKPVADIAAAPAQPNVADTAPEDPELERRKARAARFGIPLVEPTLPKSVKTGQQRNVAADSSGAPLDDPAKLEARAKRFGLSVAEAKARTTKEDSGLSKGTKRSAPAVDPEEEEKRRKRAERFGLPVTSVNA